jgi:hypothetical protein
MKSRGPSFRPVAIALAIIVVILAVIGQSILEVYGINRPILHAEKFLPSWHGTLRDPEHPPAAFLAEDFLAKLAGRDALKTEAGETLVVYEGEAPPATAEGDDNSVPKLQLDVHEPSVHGPGKKWEELGEKQKEAWKARLKEAGAWTQGMGENVFKGILFGELAGAVGRAVGG